jgi:type I restriction enzyme S subunit
MNEWKTVPLTDLYDIGSGLSKPRSEFGFGHGFLTFKDVLDNYFVPDQLSALVNSTEKEQVNCSVMRGDVFLTRTSETQHELGMSSVALKDYPKTTFNGFTKRLRPKTPDAVVPEYAAYYFRGPRFRQSVTAMSSLSTRASLNNEMISRLTIVLPPVTEQKAIGIFLKALDDKIELNRRRNRTLEAMARAIFQSWFVDFDPVQAKAAGRTPPGLKPELAALFPDRFEDSPLGPIPAGWRVGKVRELCVKVENGGTPKRQIAEYWTPAEVPWLTSGEVRQPFVVETENFISKSGFESSSAKMWPPFTTVVALYGATAGIATLLGMELCANQACCGLVPKDFASCFIHQLLSSELVSLQQQARGSAQQNLSQSIVADFPCLIPPPELLQAFENQVHCLYQRCIKGIQESRTLAALRDTLLPKLISGELRVPDAERIVGRAV